MYMFNADGVTCTYDRSEVVRFVDIIHHKRQVGLAQFEQSSDFSETFRIDHEREYSVVEKCYICMYKRLYVVRYVCCI
jgi:hypothetical protein